MKKVFGITGGGQLALMLIEALRKAYKGCYIIIYDKEKEGCAHAFADEVIVGEYDDIEKLTRFAQLCKDGITTEFETVPASAFEVFKNYTRVCPEPNAIEIGQDRLKEKNMATALGIKTPQYWEVTEALLSSWEEEVIAGYEATPGAGSIHFPLMLKTRSNGYDGKNAWKVRDLAGLRAKWEEIKKTPCIVESVVNFKFELSVIIGMNSKGEAICYPAFENVHKTIPTDKEPATLLRSTTFPGPNITVEINKRAQKIAYAIAKHLKLTGILAVEFFYDAEKDEILFNEIAPRPHNSGHGTRTTHTVSQFDMLATILAEDIVRAPIALHAGIMTNIIGFETEQAEFKAQSGNVQLTLYGKAPRLGRKVGHYDTIFPLQNHAYGNMFFTKEGVV